MEKTMYSLGKATLRVATWSTYIKEGQLTLEKMKDELNESLNAWEYSAMKSD